MNNKDFFEEVTRVMNFIAFIVEEKDLNGEIDVDINGEILHLATKKGIFVINRQPSIQEIWLSSPVSGPYHFAFMNGKWFTKSGAELFAVLSRDLGIEIKPE